MTVDQTNGFRDINKFSSLNEVASP
jgi:hypothetical protein